MRVKNDDKIPRSADVIYGHPYPNQNAVEDVPASVPVNSNDAQNLHCHVNCEQARNNETQVMVPFQFVTREMCLSQAYSNVLAFNRSCEEYMLCSRTISCAESMAIFSELMNKFACISCIPASQKKLYMKICNTSDPVTLGYETIKSPSAVLMRSGPYCGCLHLWPCVFNQN